MSLEPGAGKEVSWGIVGDWKQYKRYCDNSKVWAMLIRSPSSDMFMVVKEGMIDQLVCPECRYVISQRGAEELSQYRFLEPKIFHQRHRPLDKS